MFSANYLLFGFTVLPFPRLLFDVGYHSKCCSIVTVSQVDNIGDGGQHCTLTTRPDRSISLTDCQQELRHQKAKRLLKQTFYCSTSKRIALQLHTYQQEL